MGRFGVGQGIKRTEDQRFLTGGGRYMDDISLPRQVYAAFVRSPYAHARIDGIDLSEAKDQPGVLGLWTQADIDAAGFGDIPCIAPMKGRDGGRTLQPEHPILARGRVRHVGEPVVLVGAETVQAARDAAEMVLVDYDPVPAVTEGAKALEPGAPQLFDDVPGNLCLDWLQGDPAAVDAAFARASWVARLEMVNNRLVANSMETRAVIGDYDPSAEHYTLYTGSQGIFRLKDQYLKNILKVPEDKLRIVTPDVGGGFGMKIFAYSEQAACLFAARQLARPVKWTSDRNEAFQSDAQGRDHVTVAEMAMDDEGRFLGLRVHTIANIGAYLSNFGVYVPTGAYTPMSSGLYAIPAIVNEVKCVFTNTVPVDAYRGAGRPEAAYMIERLVDECGHVTGLGQREIRLRNFVTPAQLPYDTKLGRVYDSGDFARILQQATAAADWAGAEARRSAARGRGKLLGIGLASYVEACSGRGEEEARLTLDADGGVTLIIGTMSNGQGHHTAYGQIINDQLGVPPEKVRMIQGDSDIVKRGGGTGGSRSLLMGGVAVERGSLDLVEKTRKIAGHLLETAEADIEFADGTFTVVGTDRTVTLEAVGKAIAEGNLPGDLAEGLEGVGEYKAEALTYPNGCHVCELEIDEDTGEIDITRYVVVDDFGKIVNPLLAAGQVHGGTAQGIGQALLEATVYDEDGQLLTASYMDYTMPRAANVPDIELTFVEEMPCTTNPMGVKGAGEAGAIGAPPAIMNAIMDALRPVGVTRMDMPATPLRIWQAIEGAKAASRREAAE